MQANELRIGNYFLDRGGKVLRLDYWETPTKLAQRMFIDGQEGHPLTEELAYVKPVPLTEDWLDKATFTKENIFDCTAWSRMLGKSFELTQVDYYDDVEEIYKSDFIFNYWQDRENSENMQFEVKYVHHLQNLYFALRNQELNFNHNHEKN